MTLTAFNPGLNGFPRSLAARLPGFRPRAMRALFAEAHRQVLASLTQDYYGGVEAYNLASHLERWARAAWLMQCGAEAGKIYTTLDYFNAGLYLPGDPARLASRQREAFFVYFWERSLANLRANLSGLLKTLAIAALLPDEWYPQSVLDRQITAELKRLRIFQEISIDADLGLAPGGLVWLARATRSSVAALLERLKAGKPWPVRMILDGDHLCANRQAIAYDFTESAGKVIRIEVYEPDCICAEHAILVNLAGERPVVKETCPHDPPARLAGLVCEAYPEAAPPLECLSTWQRYAPSRRFAWRLRRWSRVFRAANPKREGLISLV